MAEYEYEHTKHHITETLWDDGWSEEKNSDALPSCYYVTDILITSSVKNTKGCDRLTAG